MPITSDKNHKLFTVVEKQWISSAVLTTCVTLSKSRNFWAWDLLLVKSCLPSSDECSFHLLALRNLALPYAYTFPLQPCQLMTAFSCTCHIQQNLEMGWIAYLFLINTLRNYCHTKTTSSFDKYAITHKSSLWRSSVRSPGCWTSFWDLALNSLSLPTLLLE